VPDTALTQATAQTNPALAYLASLPSPASQRTMRVLLGRVAHIATSGRASLESCPWHLLRYQHTAAIRAQLLTSMASSSANTALSALRRVLREAWKLGLMSADDFGKAADLKSVAVETLPAGRCLSFDELKQLFVVCADGTPGGARDAAIIATLVRGGLRRREAVSVNLEDYDPVSGALKVLHGKGRKQRMVWLKGGAKDALDAWLDVRGRDPGALFCAVGASGKVRPGKISDQALYLALARRAARAGINAFTPHDLRRTFTTGLLEADVDVLRVKRLLGHASVATTEKYDRRGQRQLEEASGVLDTPYRAGSQPEKLHEKDGDHGNRGNSDGGD
jgi:site-specific recombinase XerD